MSTAMQIIETFAAPSTKAGRLYWLPEYIRLSRDVYDNYTRTGETSERTRHISNCASRWGITRRCAEAIITKEARFDVGDLFITVTRDITEE
jgi:hypothetical protein